MFGSRWHTTACNKTIGTGPECFVECGSQKVSRATYKKTVGTGPECFVVTGSQKVSRATYNKTVGTGPESFVDDDDDDVDHHCSTKLEMLGTDQTYMLVLVALVSNLLDITIGCTTMLMMMMLMTFNDDHVDKDDVDQWGRHRCTPTRLYAMMMMTTMMMMMMTNEMTMMMDDVDDDDDDDDG